MSAAPAPIRMVERVKFSRWAARHAAFFVVLALSAWYAAANLDRGWVPHDDGALAQSAERVLHGELPHRDFAEIYGGALDYPHALAFLVFGTKLTSLRWVLLGAFLLWLPVLYRTALLSSPPWIAALLTFLAAVWTIPNYSASMPSWYNLFLANGAALCLLLFAERRHKKWLFVAGLCCGLSIIIKITGVYALAAALLACVYLQTDGENPHKKDSGRAYLIFVTGCLLVFLAVVVRVLGERTTADELFAFAMPCALVSYLLARKVAQQTTHDFAAFVRLARTMGPLMVGVLVPIAVFLTPYLATHSVADLVEGTLIAPFRRVNITVAEPTEWERTWPAAILVGLLVLATHFRLSKTVQALIAGMGIYFVYRSGSADSVGLLRVLWHSMYDIVPWLLFAIVVWTVLTRPHKAPGSQMFVLLAFVACCNLSRFPYSARIYFCYIAPLVFLAAQSWLLQTPLRSRGVLIAVLAFFVIFNVMRLRPTFLEMGAYYAPDIYTVPFTIERASGIRTKAEGVATYEEIVKLVQEHSTGTVIYAGPDAPEVYFLTGKKNPTRDIFNFLNDSANADAMQALGRKDIDVVVWNRSPQFSHAPTLELRQRIERDYPHLQQVGAFDVRWK